MKRHAEREQRVPSEATPLLPESGRCSGRLQEHSSEGPRFCVYKPPRPLDDQGRPPPPQLLHYNARHVSSVLSLLTLRGTVFASWPIWLHGLGHAALAVLVCVFVLLSCRSPELIDTDRAAELIVYSSALVGFLLVLYISAAVRRWWALRLEALGGLWAAVGDLSLLLSAHLPHGSRELKALVLRYGLASFELTFMQAQGTDGMLRGLVEERMLTEDEKRKLEELVSKPQAMWVWIAGAFRQLAERGLFSSRLLVTVYGICSRARASVGRGQGAFTYLDTQLPFSYVHLVSVLVHLNNVAISVKSGVVAAVAIGNIRRPETRGHAVSDTENMYVLLLQVIFVIGVTALYHAVLETSAALSDPLNDRFQDFPRRAYHVLMKSECEALHEAGENLPVEACQVTEDFEVQEGDFVQDRVALLQLAEP